MIENNDIKLWQKIFLTCSIVVFIFSFFLSDRYNLYDYLKTKPIQSYNEKHKEHLISCLYCKGAGERIEDVNKTMFLAKTQLYLNKHLNIDKCEKCVKLEDSDGYDYCSEAKTQYEIFVKEYAAAGPNMIKTGCSECLGAGKFTIFDRKNNRYLTQEEYENKEKSNKNKL